MHNAMNDEAVERRTKELVRTKHWSRKRAYAQAYEEHARDATSTAAATPQRVTTQPDAPPKSSPRVKLAPTSRRPAATTVVKRSVSSVVTEMVVDGRTNEEINDVLLTDYALDVGPGGRHRYYAGWYRARAVRDGLIDRPFAMTHAHARTGGASC